MSSPFACLFLELFLDVPLPKKESKISEISEKISSKSPPENPP